MGDEPRPQDQMRPITALFADIVGSNGFGERLGPDEVKALIARVRHRRGFEAPRGGNLVGAVTMA